MNKNQILAGIMEEKIVSILRVSDSSKVIPASLALLEGGIKVIEISLNTPKALVCMTKLARIDGIVPGAGTVTDKEMAIESIEAGAEFIVTPITRKDVINTCHDLGKPVFSGAFTPSEIFQAHEWGADVIKVFPAETLGMNYIKAVKAPFPDIKLMPTGGVTPDNIDKWLDMGANCVGVGSSFTKPDILDNEEWGRLTGIAKEFTSNIAHYKTNRKNHH
ncbi:MAG: bifunctional 4-hydroxy-2-oxoglutarate aldolase/2-dehydro-3-deoxy-phosphogluconate aldolase [Cytophagales bacterium]|nr:bifunctional 4-hydroxy-2-oxoglutarate aldolase/2-dehydro-3-deoxy-phosphogluconate aldolase [Cytophagales bacterium]